MRSALLVVCIACLGVAQADEQTSLLDYAQTQQFPHSNSDLVTAARVKHAQHEIDRQMPPDTDCSRTLGASRFGYLYEDLGSALSARGEHEAAAEAYKRSLNCSPRAARLNAQLATEMLRMNRYVEARAIAEHAATDEDSQDQINFVLAQIDYIEEHWNEAAVRLRTAVVEAEDDTLATYWECLYWLAQRHGGNATPQLVDRELTDEWPQPILLTLQGNMSERALIETIDDETDLERRREILVEALYYLGELNLARGQRDTGRRYLAAAVNLKRTDFIEHDLALADLAKIRAISKAQLAD